MVKFQMNAPRISVKSVSDFARIFVAKVAEPEMLNQALIMRKRAQSNQRATGGPIRSGYSDSYLRAIIAGTAKGANGTRKASTTPNLTVTGEFLSSMQTRKLPNGAAVFFSGNHASKGSATLQNATLAGYLFGMGFDGWFAFSDEDKARIHKSFERFLNDYSKDLVTIK